MALTEVLLVLLCLNLPSSWSCCCTHVTCQKCYKNPPHRTAPSRRPRIMDKAEGGGDGADNSAPSFRLKFCRNTPECELGEICIRDQCRHALESMGIFAPYSGPPLGPPCGRVGECAFHGDHELCRRREVEEGGIFANNDDAKYATSRCMPSLGYRCARAHMMPCTPNWDEKGDVVEGQEMSCPENFECKKPPGGGDSVCVASKLDEGLQPGKNGTIGCESDFDCGFDADVKMAWTKCDKKRNKCNLI